MKVRPKLSTNFMVSHIIVGRSMVDITSRKSEINLICVNFREV